MLRRWSRSAIVSLGLVVALAGTALAAITWSPAQDTATAGKVGPNYIWNYGSSLDVMGNGKVALAYSTDYIGGSWATDTGPYQGTYVMTGTVGAGGAVTWAKGKRVSPGTKHAERPSLAAGGSNVYAVYVTQTSYDAYDAAAPRVAYVRVNTSNGAGTAWQKAVRLSPGTGRVDYPVVAADGSNAYVAWADAANGNVNVSLSNDSGTTWAKKKIGVTTRDQGDGEGFIAWPGICAAGSNVGVVWLSDDGGKLSYAISQDAGATWPTKGDLAASGAADNFAWGQCDAVGDRLGFAWTTATDLKYREFNSTSDTWGAERSAATFVNAKTLLKTDYESGYAAAPALYGAGQVAITWGDCRNLGCDYNLNVTRIDLSYVESSDNGATFSGRTKLADSGVKGKALNDSPSILWYDGTTRIIVYNGWTANYFYYRLFGVSGSGAI